MARGTSGTNTQISGTYTSHLGLSSFSMSAWMRRPSSGSLQFIGFNENSSHRSGLLHFTDNVLYAVLANGSNSFGSVTQDVTGWHHWAMTFDGSQTGNSNRLKLFYDGSQQSLSFTGTIPATTSSNALNQTFRAGRAQANNAWSTGDFAEYAMYSATLSEGEVKSLAAGFTPDKIRPQSLLAYIPLVRAIQDVVSATTLTDASTTAEPHPRVYA